jgi:hypothetical protein
VGIDFEMVARKFGHWALFDKAAEQRLAPLFNGQKHGHSVDQTLCSARWIILYMEAMISRKKIVKSIGLMHPFTYRGPSSKHRTNVHVIRPNPPCKYVSKSKIQCSSHLLVPLEALDRDRLESLVLRSELSLPRLGVSK